MKTFDYIVVGAGSAGCVLAAGLSSRNSVLVIEAGGSMTGLKVAIPAAFSRNFQTERDWAFYSEPEPSGNGRSLFIPRGKGLGGSSSINAMIYMRGRAGDYARWESLGAEGWGWADVAPVFRSMESNRRFADDHHGTDGPLRVEDLRSPNPYSRRFVAAALEAGLSANPDFNGATQEGVGYFQVNQRRGRRWSAYDAYLRPVLDRPTLEIVTAAHCLGIRITNGRAVAVDYLKDGRKHTAAAESEVIVSAGAIGSPQILQLSGIGDPAHLRDLGIEPNVANVHVGSHLRDHPAIGVIQQVTSGGTLDDAETLAELIKWRMWRRGRLTSNVAEAGAFVKSGPEVSQPDLQFHFGPSNFEDHGMAASPGRAISLGTVLLHPTSEGSVLARSADPTQPPAISGNYLADPTDVDTLMRGLRQAREIIAASTFDGVRGAELRPGPEVTTDEELRAFIRQFFELLYHPIGTCRIGGGSEGVVDHRLKVNGVDGLRVADASVMPATVSGNTNAPTMMIAQRAVDMILG